MRSEDGTEQFANATIRCKANVYFDGKVVSHAVTTADGSRKSLGVIQTGQYHFETAGAERMDIIAGSCRARVRGEADWTTYTAGSGFDVPARSAFDIAVDDGLTEYLCSFDA
jgi:uncharacterized protein YaiE (UPF0345 family)